MAGTLRHRGPDDEGLHAEDGIALGFRRLSVIDLETGNQPVSNEAGDVRAVFNGEIYNYRDLRTALEREGHVFRTQGDAEVIPHLYEALGKGLVHELRGMFALAVWDAKRGQVLLARDRMGEKPLFYTQHVPSAQFAFASEIKALLAAGVSREPDMRALVEYLYHLYVPDPRSAFASIRKLPPGHTLMYRDGTVEVERYWQPNFDVRHRSTAEHLEGLREHVLDAVRSRLVADVPVGAFLSGGLDSSTVVSCMRRAGGAPVHTFTITFEGAEHYDESADARAAADHLGTTHHELQGRLDAVATVPAIVESFDEPFGNATAALLSTLSKETREHVKVVLTGDGADELFFGYPRFRGLDMAQRYQHLPTVVQRAGSALARFLPESTSGRHSLRRAREFLTDGSRPPIEAYQAWIGYFTPEFLEEALAPELRGFAPATTDFLGGLFNGQLNDLNDLSRVELQSFLPHNVLAYADRMSMAHGLELRAPFVDHRLVDYVATMPVDTKLRRGVTKWALREAFKADLPPIAVSKRKRGLNPPLGAWLRDAEPLVRELLDPVALRRRGILKPEAVAGLLDEQRRGRRDRALHIWGLMVLEMWFRMRVDEAPQPQYGDDPASLAHCGAGR